MCSSNLSDLARLAEEACKKAAKLLSEGPGFVANEVGHDVKSEADLGADAAIRSVLERAGIPVLSEESGDRNLERDCWIVDPLDGTMNFTRSIPLYCVSIALWRGNRTVLGVVYDFNADQLYVGGPDIAATCNGVPIRVSGRRNPDESIIATGFPSGRSYAASDLADFVELVRRFRKVRLLGSAALSLTWVARGWVDAYLEEDIYLWDVAAGLAIVQGAGGEVSMRWGEGMRLTLLACGTLALLNASNHFDEA